MEMGLASFAPYVKVKNLVEPYKRFTPAVFFTGGFTWDSLTLQRIDNFLGNMILLAYLILLSLLVVLTNLAMREKIRNRMLTRFSSWYPMGMQFFLGGLFSSYVVFYFHSASMTSSSTFLLILVLLLVANEFLEDRMNNVPLQMTLYFLSAFSFFIFFIPVITKSMSHLTFLAGGFAALILTGSLIYFFYKRGVFRSMRQYTVTFSIVAFSFFTVNMFYIQNWIPPVPLSVKHSGIYHKVERADGAYALQYEKPRWYRFWLKYDARYNYREGDCFASIFAPTKLKKGITHVWQKYSKHDKGWVTTDSLSYPIVGGRDGGYRGYSFKRNVSEGKWRVELRTDDGLLLGRVAFRIDKEDTASQRTMEKLTI